MAAKKSRKPAITGLGRPAGILDDIFAPLGKKVVGELRKVARKEVKAYKPVIYRTEKEAGKVHFSKDGGIYSKIEHGYGMKEKYAKNPATRREVLEHRSTIERAVKKQTGVGNKKAENIAAKIQMEERAAVAKRAKKRAEARAKAKDIKKKER